MEHKYSNSRAWDSYKQYDDWDEVHRQLQEVQKKSMNLSEPDDADEIEADNVARKVVNGEAATIANTRTDINRKEEGTAVTPPEFLSKLNSNKNAGHQLPSELQEEMGSKMGADFRDVKIHTGTEPNSLTESINAKAFTHGQDIYFNRDQYNPTSDDGRELIAHELVHTVQQTNNTQEARADRIVHRQQTPGSARLAAHSFGKVTPYTPSTLVLTDYELHMYIATVMAESAQGAVQPKEVAWVYYNIINDGVAKGQTVEETLHASIAASGTYDKKTKTYSGPNGWWKGYMTGLGETKYENEKIPSYMVVKGLPTGSTYADYVKTEYYVNHTAPIVEDVKNFIVNTILKKPALNPYPGFHNQGYYRDLNRKDKLWQTARAYFWLQEDGTVTDIYVKELYAGYNTTFLFNSTKILAYFDKNPDKLPAEVPEYDPVTRGKKK